MPYMTAMTVYDVWAVTASRMPSFDGLQAFSENAIFGGGNKTFNELANKNICNGQVCDIDNTKTIIP